MISVNLSAFHVYWDQTDSELEGHLLVERDLTLNADNTACKE